LRVSLPAGSRILGLVVDAAKTAFHGYPCREGTLFQYERTAIAKARMGEMVKIVGRLRATTTLFTAPLTGATCVWYRTIAQTWDGFLYSPRRIIEHKWQDFFVEDDTGSALVRMQGAEVSLEEMRGPWCYEPPAPWDDLNNAATENVRRFLAAHGFELSYHKRSILERMRSEEPKKRGARYREFVLREGDRVAVLGEAVRQPDPAVPADGLRRPVLQLVLGEATAAPIVSNEPGVWS
jgi:hypothetical protein